MSYHALGAGPGPTLTYKVDLPFPWGSDTPITVPMEAIVHDAVKAVPVQQLATAFVDEAWPEAKKLAIADLPEIIDKAIAPKWGQAEYILNQTLGEVEDRVRKIKTELLIGAGLAVVALGALIIWRTKR
jgi:p-aminobenzoyl-glutamate transporter AbgT